MMGNLISRSDSLTSGNVSEKFDYDILNRLTSAQVTNGSGVQTALAYGYDALGNITGKSDTGTYTYGATRPHAVASVAGVNPGTYAYDSNGNMTNRNGTVITWNSDNMPASITQSSSNSSQFAYAPDKHRYYQTAMIAGVSETTVYVGAYEAVTTGGVTKYRHHLMADGREVAEVDLSNSGSTVNETVSYILSDHLGSVDVVQTTKPDGTLISTTSMSFAAWGNRREPTTTWLPPVTQAEAQADHNANRYGFTHQEMLDNVALIHMNGRVYDPNLGRFLSVDPVFQFPTNTQSLNPYSYVLNNPLSLTDPSGYCALTSADVDKYNTAICGSGLDDANRVYKGHNDTGSMDHLAGSKLAAFDKALQKGIAALSANKDALEKKFGSGTFILGWNKNQAVVLKGNGATGEADKTGTNTADLMSGNGASAREARAVKNYGTDNKIATYPDGSQIIDAYTHEPMIAPQVANMALSIAWGKGIASLPVIARDAFMYLAFKPHGFLEFQHNVLDPSDERWYGEYMGYGNYTYGAVGRAAGYTRIGIGIYGEHGVFLAHFHDAIKTRQLWRLVPTNENWTEWGQGIDDYDKGRLNYH